MAWLNTPKEGKASARQTGIKLQAVESKGEMSIARVVEMYLSDFCNPSINSDTAIKKAKRHCFHLMEFFKEKRIALYSGIRREHIAGYPEWRKCKRFDGRAGNASADTINQELHRLGAIIRHGVKFCGWQEKYLLDGVKVKATTENTKAVKPFEISEVKTILSWLWQNAKKTGNWYIHDMALLAVCSGLESKALTYLQRDWFKMDWGFCGCMINWLAG